jgi:type IV secretory pathway VirB2 component (pilin)
MPKKSSAFLLKTFLVAIFGLALFVPQAVEAQTNLPEDCPTKVWNRDGTCDRDSNLVIPPPNNQPAPTNSPPATTTQTQNPRPATSTPGNPCDGGTTVGSTPICLPNNPLGNNTSGIASTRSVTELIARVINILLFFAGIVAVVFVIIGGFMYMTARGNDTQAGQGIKTLKHALVGLVIVILAYVLVRVVVDFLVR